MGLLLMAGGFALFSTVRVHSGYPRLLLHLLMLGAGLALATTLATTAIVSSLPQNKLGVASAVSDRGRSEASRRSGRR